MNDFHDLTAYLLGELSETERAAVEAALAADPLAAEKGRRAKKICNCKSVDLGTIEDAIRAQGNWINRINPAASSQSDPWCGNTSSDWPCGR